MYFLELIVAVLLTVMAFLALWVRSLGLGGFLFLVGGFGVALLIDLILVGVPVDRLLDLVVGKSFFLAWLLLFVLLQLFLRRTPAGKMIFDRVQAVLEEIETALPGGWDDDPDYVEQRQFNYSIEVAAQRMKEKQRRARELHGIEAPIERKPPEGGSNLLK